MPLVFRRWCFHRFWSRSRSRRVGASFVYVTRCESKLCASSVDPLVPRKELQTGLHCTPACIYSKRDANAMKYLRYQRRRKKVPPARRGRCLKGCKQSWYETHAIQNPRIHEQSYSKMWLQKVFPFVCALHCTYLLIYIYIYKLMRIYIFTYIYIYIHMHVCIYVCTSL